MKIITIFVFQKTIKKETGQGKITNTVNFCEGVAARMVIVFNI